MTSTNSTTPKLGPLNFTILHASDLAAARSFYVETLGLTLVAESPAFLQFSRADGAGASLGISPEQVPGVGAPSSIELWWEVEDTDALHAALVERSVNIIAAPKDEPFGRSLTFADPAGNALNVYQPPKGS